MGGGDEATIRTAMTRSASDSAMTDCGLFAPAIAETRAADFDFEAYSRKIVRYAGMGEGSERQGQLWWATSSSLPCCLRPKMHRGRFLRCL